jgi:hypothetical protein
MPRGVAAWRRAASRRRASCLSWLAMARAPERRALRASAARLQAVQAVGAVQGSSPPVPILGRDEAKAAAGRGKVEEVAAKQREQPRTRKRQHCPGRDGVEARRRILCSAQQPAPAPECFADANRTDARSDRVAEVFARPFLVVVGEVRPAVRRCRSTGYAGGRGQVPAAGSAIRIHAGRQRRGCYPARGVPLRLPSVDRFATSVESRCGDEVEAEQEARDPPSLGPVAGGGEGDGDGPGVAGPDIGPAGSGARRHRSGASVGQRPQHEQRALVHRPRPPRRRDAKRSGTADPAPVGHSRHGPAERADDGAPRSSEPGHGAQHVGPSQVALLDRVGAPEGEPPAADEGARGEPGIGRHRAGGQPLRRHLDTSPAGRSPEAQVDDIAIGVHGGRRPAVPDHRDAEEGGGQSRQARRRGGVVAVAPGHSDSRSEDRPDCKRCTSRGHPSMQSAADPAGR